MSQLKDDVLQQLDTICNKLPKDVASKIRKTADGFKNICEVVKEVEDEKLNKPFQMDQVEINQLKRWKEIRSNFVE